MRHVLSLLWLCPLLIVGCATIMQGTTQPMAVSSNPSGATIHVNGVDRARTPAVIDLTRKENHIISLRMDGYRPYEVAVSRSVSGWVVGNIVFGGLIGLAVDAISGGLYKLSPESVTGDLRGMIVLEGTDDVLVLTVVLDVDPSWEKVGQLTPAD